MKLPVKISPARIRDAIVQVHFHASIPFEPLIGYFYEALTEIGFSYTNRPIRPNHFLPPGTQSLPSSIDILLEPQYIFFNEEIRMQVQNDGSLVFNCLNAYPGWTNYFAQIKRVFGQLLERKILPGFHRIGIRYISEFPNVDILENVNFKVELEGLDVPMTNGSFRVEWMKEPHRFIVNLASKLPIEPMVVPVEGKVDYTSLIDIDVIEQNFFEEDPDRLFVRIDQAHLKEKEQFFQLLKPMFLETLKPEYT